MNTRTMEVFAEVARQQSFSEAARVLRMSSTAISRHIRQLEDHLGVRLLHRTTRRVSLTPDGVAALARIEMILGELSELKDAVGGTGRPRGHLRITAGVSLGAERLNRILPAFVAEHPEVSVKLMLTDRHVDLVAERIDLAIRVGRMTDSGLVVRRLGTIRHRICAAPALLSGQQITPDALAGLPQIIDTNQPAQWSLRGPNGQTMQVPAVGRYAVNSAHGACIACCAGLGVAMLPDFVCEDALAVGTLVEVLPGWEGPSLTLQALYLERRHLSAAVRALVDRLVAVWDGSGAEAG
ncbi:MAG: DNA-binding transcriptional LysR family regulator [Myxococcota bacterium]|jgi:DNA-binding transcriptional LysR family regulator